VALCCVRLLVVPSRGVGRRPVPACEQVLNELRDRVGGSRGEIDELDTSTVKHLFAVKMADRRMDHSGFDDDRANVKRQADVMQGADLECGSGVDLGPGRGDLGDPHRLDDRDASREPIVGVDPGILAPILRHVARL